MKLLKYLFPLFLILFVSVSFIRLGRDYLFDWDESIYAELGREMVQSGNLLTPTWNHALWLEKPPLIVWTTALTLKLGGINEFSARMAMPIVAGLTLTFVYLIGKKLGGIYLGIFAATLLGYFNLFLSRVRTVNTDIMLLAGITGTVWLSLTRNSPLLLGLISGLAVMAKGPAGLLALVIVSPLLVRSKKAFLIRSLLSFLLVVIPWHLYQLLVNGSQFVTPYLLEQVVKRAGTAIEFHRESRWFYLTFLSQDLGIGMLIGVLVGIFGLFSLYRHSKIKEPLLLLWWLLVPLAIFTLAKTRLSWYILPIYPAIALVIAWGLNWLLSTDKNRKVTTLLVIGFCCQTLYHAYQYVEPTRAVSHLPDLLKVGTQLSSIAGEKLAFLVSASERTAEAILPADQRISSSFRYGGAPSLVWYSGKQVNYYYNYDEFTHALTIGQYPLAIVSTDDRDKVPAGYLPVIETQSYLGFSGDNLYAQH